MPIELIISLVVFGLLTLGGIILYCIDGYKRYAGKSMWMQVLMGIYHIVLGAPYLIIRGIEKLIEWKNTRTHKEVKVL